MPLPAPKPVDALRQHTRAVVLISANGDASPALLDAIRDSEIPCELIGHPVVAMAELVRLEHGSRDGSERTALFVADDERIEQLASLFQSVRARLPQVGIWVIAGDFAVQVQRAIAIEQPVAVGTGHAHDGATTRAPHRSAPQLRIVDHSRDAEPVPSTPAPANGADDESDARQDPDAPHSTAISAEELDMLLGWGDEPSDGTPGGNGPSGGRR